MKKFTLISAMLFLAVSLSAQTPLAFKYQAVARNSSGNLIQNQLVAFRISILQGGPSGTLVYQERHTPTTNNFGLANLEIGRGTILFGTFNSINWSGGQMFLKVELDPVGGTAYQDMGTTELLSVPFALYAGQSASGWLLTGNSGINPATDFLGTNDNAALKFRVGGLTAGFMDPLSGNTSFGFKALFSSAGNHNTALGRTALESNTSGSFNTAIGKDALNTNTIGNYNTAFGYHADVISGDLTNSTAIGNGALAASSNEVRLGNSDVTSLYCMGPNGTTTPNAPNLYFDPATGRFMRSTNPSGSGNNWLTTGNNLTGTELLGSTNEQPLRFFSKNIERMRITEDGNIGIGTSSPDASAKLQVSSTSQGFLLPRMTSWQVYAITSPAPGLIIFNTDLSTFQFRDENHWRNLNGSHYIGECFGGGIVFYIYDNGQHGLIAAAADQSVGIQWYNGTNKITGTTGTGLGAGEMNTAMIVVEQLADDESGNFAAKVCADYSVIVGGVTYGDWYLPSIYELGLLYEQSEVVGGFTGTWYWSSTESISNIAWAFYFTDGYANTRYKYAILNVRAVRAF